MPSRTVLVTVAIRNAILAGRLRPGQALVEAELARMLNVSKTPVREALKALSGTGLVVMNPYRGAAVRTVDGELARSVCDLRLLLEPEAVRRSGRFTRDWTEAARALDRAEAADTDGAERGLANRDFHRALYADCGNPTLVRTLDNLRDQTALVATLAWRRTASWRREAEEHRAILAAARGHDTDRAAALVTAHIQAFLGRNFPLQVAGSNSRGA